MLGTVSLLKDQTFIQAESTLCTEFTLHGWNKYRQLLIATLLVRLEQDLNKARWALFSPILNSYDL